MAYDVGVASTLKEERFPPDWYYRYGGRLKQEYVNFMWEDYPALHRYRGIGGAHYLDYLNRVGIFEGEAPNNDDILWAYHFYNTTAALYLAHGIDSSMPKRDREHTQPASLTKWMSIAYDTWADTCGRRERSDARFVFAPLHLQAQDEKRVRKCIELATLDQPGCPEQYDMQRLIEWHIQHCDLLEAVAARDVSRDEEEFVGELVTTEGLARLAKAHHSVITPTFRAILTIATEALTDVQHILLVLTGHNETMVSGAPTFDSIVGEVIEWKSEKIVVVSLQTAVRFLRLVEQKEEAVNTALRTKNDERREAMYEHLRNKAAREVEAMRTYYGRRPLFRRARRQQTGRLRRHRLNVPLILIDVVISAAWEEIVADEDSFAVLSSTKELRQALCEDEEADVRMEAGPDSRHSPALDSWQNIGRCNMC